MKKMYVFLVLCFILISCGKNVDSQIKCEIYTPEIMEISSELTNVQLTFTVWLIDGKSIDPYFFLVNNDNGELSEPVSSGVPLSLNASTGFRVNLDSAKFFSQGMNHITVKSWKSKDRSGNEIPIIANEIVINFTNE